MMTKYGNIADEYFERYKRSLVSRIYALLPMKEENLDTVSEYVERISRELIAHIDVFDHCEHVISVVCLLEWIIMEEDHSIYRKEILRCCNIISRIGEGGAADV